MKTREEIEAICKQVVDATFHVHKEMGPGLVESIYTHCIVHELRLRNLHVQREVFIPLVYKGIELPKDFRIDILVENEVVLEIKAVETLHPVFEAQVISYLKLTDKRIGFLINFNVPLIKDGIRRYVNKL